MTNDGVLVGKFDDEMIVGDRPVVPNVPYTSPVQGAPKAITWKHVLLAAVHNTATGSHKNHKEMQIELNSLVMWWPPEDLGKDCRTRVGRCKLCVTAHGKSCSEPAYQAFAVQTILPRADGPDVGLTEGNKW